MTAGKLKLLTATLLAGATLWRSTDPAAAQGLLNGNFATGNFTDWTTQGPYLQVGGSPGNYYVYAGAGYGDNGTVGDFVSQTLTTIPGDTYHLSIYVEGSGYPNFSDTYLSWNGAKALDLPGATFNGWTLIQTNVTATSAQSTFAFGSYTPFSYNFEDASVMVVPEPAATAVLMLGGLLVLASVVRQSKLSRPKA